MESVAHWSPVRVARWFSQNGFPGHEQALREQDIDGAVLLDLDHEALKDLGLRALGRRVLVLKAIYFLKLQHDIPIGSDGYVPHTVDVEPDARVRRRDTQLAEDVNALAAEVAAVRNDMQRMYRLAVLEHKPLPPPLKPDRAQAVPPARSLSSLVLPPTPHIRVYGDDALQRENEAYKSFRISADDPCSTILPHALKKYHINDAWQNYSLCIQFGGPGSARPKSERMLATDERPLHLFQQLKDAGESPVFVLKKKGPDAAASLFSLDARAHPSSSSSSLSLEVPPKPGSSSSTHEFEKL
ncbi:Adaptor for signal transduction [Coemansia sp. RSA 552]|nr:Adaptor for signal transduction [Coemansia sp. RSA 552]